MASLVLPVRDQCLGILVVLASVSKSFSPYFAFVSLADLRVIAMASGIRPER